MRISPSSKVPDEAVNPSNLSAERCVLGALIEDAALLPELLASGLRIQHFYLSDHRRVFDAIQRLTERAVPIDYVSVAEQLGNRQDDYICIAGLVHGVVLNDQHVLHHASIVRRKSHLRALLRIGDWITGAVTETADPSALATQIRNMLEACSEDQIQA